MYQESRSGGIAAYNVMLNGLLRATGNETRRGGFWYYGRRSGFPLTKHSYMLAFGLCPKRRYVREGDIIAKQGGTAGFSCPGNYYNCGTGFLFIFLSLSLRKETIYYVKRKNSYKIYLEESEMPKAWYNLRADMKQSQRRCLTPRHASNDG